MKDFLELMDKRMTEHAIVTDNLLSSYLICKHTLEYMLSGNCSKEHAQDSLAIADYFCKNRFKKHGTIDQVWNEFLNNKTKETWDLTHQDKTADLLQSATAE